MLVQQQYFAAFVLHLIRIKRLVLRNPVNCTKLLRLFAFGAFFLTVETGLSTFYSDLRKMCMDFFSCVAYMYKCNNFD